MRAIPPLPASLKTTEVLMSAVAVAPIADPVNRFNIYAVVHKGLRGFMVETLTAVGRMDVNDECEAAKAISKVRTLLSFCRSHIKHEDEFLHPALEKARAGAAATTAHDHEHHIEEIEVLERETAVFDAASASAKRSRVHDLYLQLACFVAENFRHMNVEETDNHRVLIDAYTDAEILAINAALVATISPQNHAIWLRWMLFYGNAGERAKLLGGMKAGAPRP